MRTGARAGRFFVILLTLCSALIMVAPGAAQDPTVVDRQLSLQIDTANDTVAPGGETSVLLTATNTGAEPIEAVSLHLHDAPGVAWSEDFNGPWVKLGDMKPGESRVLNGRVRVAGPHDDNAVTLFATLDGRDAAPTEAQAQLFMPAPPSEESTVDARGGAVEAADGRVEFDFPPDWNETAVELTFQLREETPLRPDETGRLLLFDVSAVAGDTAVDAFDRPVTVEVTLADLLDPVAAAARPPVVAVRPDEATPWTAVKSDFDAKSGVLTFTTTHFSTYQVSSEPELWRLLYNPPVTSLYTGATAETIDIGHDREGENSLIAGGTQLILNVGFTERGQPALRDRQYAPDTSLVYYGAAGNFRLNKILHGPEGGTLPDFIYSAYDAVGNLTGFTAGPHSYAYTYDDLNRLLTVTGAISRGYTYDRLGNFNSVTRAGVQWVYGYAAGNPSRLMSVSHLPLTVNATGGYDNRGNLVKYTKSGVAYELTFDAGNRLSSVKVGSGTPTVFAYDADGQRVQTTFPDGTIVYTPFPDYEIEDPPTGADVTRTTYRLAGQIVAVQHKVGTAAGTFYFTYGDRLGNIAGLSYTGGTFLSNSTAYYDPFGTFTTTPGTNPSLTNHGFTGHRHNNTGTNNLGLIYMNARYYLPEVGRFVSPDTIVPEPGNPQSFNRYSYVLNSPLNFTDPTGHRFTDGCESGCLSDPENWGENFVVYMAQKPDRFTQAVYGTYLDYYNQHAAILDVPPEMVEYTLWQIAYETTDKLEAKLHEGGWFTSVLADIFGSGTIDAFDVIEGSVGVFLAMAHGGESGPRMNPFDIRFSQSSINYYFRDGSSIDDLATGLRQGGVSPTDIPPIRVTDVDGVLYTLDNRRLEAFRRAGIDIPYRIATPLEAAKAQWKFTSKNAGTSVRIRNLP